jgi:hypothetical protein
MDKQELGAFLRSRRERLRPEDVGLPSGPRRRTPGLRREEIAVLAYISTEVLAWNDLTAALIEDFARLRTAGTQPRTKGVPRPGAT